MVSELKTTLDTEPALYTVKKRLFSKSANHVLVNVSLLLFYKQKFEKTTVNIKTINLSDSHIQHYKQD